MFFDGLRCKNLFEYVYKYSNVWVKVKSFFILCYLFTFCDKVLVRVMLNMLCENVGTRTINMIKIHKLKRMIYK